MPLEYIPKFHENRFLKEICIILNLIIIKININTKAIEYLKEEQKVREVII